MMLREGSGFRRSVMMMVNESHETTSDIQSHAITIREGFRTVPVPSTDFPVKRALIVEDDPELIPVFATALNEVYSHFEIDWVKTGEDAIRKAHECRYDIIFVDIILNGERNGIEVWQDLEKFSPSTPVVIASAMPIDSFLKSIGRESITPPFISKPLRVGELKQMISGLMSEVGPVS